MSNPLSKFQEFSPSLYCANKIKTVQTFRGKIGQSTLKIYNSKNTPTKFMKICTKLPNRIRNPH